MATITSTDITSHPLFAIARLDSGRTVKYPKVKPTGSSDATDAAWQSRMSTEIQNAVNVTQASGNNSVQTLTSLV